MPLNVPQEKETTQATILVVQHEGGTTEEGTSTSQKSNETDVQKKLSAPSIRVGQAEDSDYEMRRLEDLKSDDEFHTASECTLRQSPRSSAYDSASECEARYSPWWDYGKKLDEDISKEKMILAVGCPQLPAPEEVLKDSPSVPSGKIVHEVIETTHIRVEHSHKMGVKSFVLSSETVRDNKSGGYSTTEEQVIQPVLIHSQKQEGEEDYDDSLKKLEKCGNWLQLKILEITPELTKLGNTLIEALELQKAHDEVLRQIKNKQSPVEELLRQADQLIATQKPRAEVYAAMAETLGRAWRDINFNLELRKQILDLNVQYHSQASEFFEKIRTLEESCTDTVIPIDIQAVKDFLTSIHNLRRTLLESLMAALQAGNSLLGKLKELGTEGTLDSRPDQIRLSVNKALSQVQSWLDELHAKREDVEAIFNRRKLQLEQCLALAILAADLRQLEETVNNSRNRLANADQLGDSTSSAELLQHENRKLLPEAQLLQEKALKITKATEQLLASGCFAGEEATKQSYAILSLTSDYLTEVQNRNALLERVVEFFKSAQSAFNKLNQLEIQLGSSNLRSTSSEFADLHAQCAKAIEEIAVDPIAEGHAILDVAARSSTGTEGVRRTVEELENFKIRLDALCVAHREENLRINRALENFFDSYLSINTWLTSIAEAFLEGHQNMGWDLSMANDFMNLHNKLLTDLQDKGNEINTLLLTLPPILEYLDDDKRSDIDGKVEELHERWMRLKNILENRLDLGRIYVKFHMEAEIVNSEIDKLDDELQSKGQDIDDDTMKNLEIKWESIEPLYQSAKNTGLTFINDARKVSEPHLDTKRACVCVEAVLEKLAGRQLQVTRNWQSFYTDIIEKKELLVKLEETMVESTRTINWVTKLEAQLYPVITMNSTSAKDLASFVKNKLETILPDIRRAQNEVEQKIKTADILIAKVSTNDEKTLNVKNKLSELNQKLIEITTDFEILLEMLISFFNSVNELDLTIGKVNSRIQDVTHVNDITTIKSLMSEHDASKHIVLEMFNAAQNECDRIIQRISKQEPTDAAEHDIDKLRQILELRRSDWKSQIQHKWEILEKQYTFCQFDEDLNNINKSINNLEHQNNELKSRYGKSLEEAEASSFAYSVFEKTIQDLEKKIKAFIDGGNKLLSEKHSHSPLIQKHIRELQERWETFKKQMHQTRYLIDQSIQYFQLVNKADEWFKQGSRLLISIARRTSLVQNPKEAEDLLNEISTFLRPGEEKQNERIQQITTLAELIYGSTLPELYSQVLNENREMLKSFNIIQSELDMLNINLLKAEEEKKRHQKEQEEAAVRLAAEALAAEKSRLQKEQQEAAAKLAAMKAEALAAEKARQQEQEEAALKLAAMKAEALAAEKARQQKVQDEAALKLAAMKAEALAVENVRQQKEQEEAELKFATIKAEALAAEEAKSAAERRRIEMETAVKLAQQKKSINENIISEEARKAVVTTVGQSEKHTIIQVQLNASPLKSTTNLETTIEKLVNKGVDNLESPVFISPLADAVIQEGSKFSFICQLRGLPVPVVTWYKAGVPIQNNPDYQTTFDQNICTLTIEETFSDDSARYTCKAINAVGAAETSAYLSVKEMESEEQLLPPSFSKYLESAFVKEGSSFQFHCKVEGNPLPNVQWFKNQECIDYLPGYHITYNNGEAILKFERVDCKDKDDYTCKATNQIGSAQSTASLSITPMIPAKSPTILSPLSNVMARAGQKIKLECEVTGLPIPDIVWFQNGHILQETRELKIQRDGDKATLVIYEAFPKDAGNYRVAATNVVGQASSSCSVSVKGRVPTETSDSEIASDMEPVKPSIQLPLVDLTVGEGSRVRLDCVIIGQPEPEVIWYHDNRPVKESSDFQLLFQGDRCSLVIQKAFSEDGGEYKVVALNSAGEASSKCSLAVKPNKAEIINGQDRTISVGYAPKFNKLLADVLVSEGEKVIFEGNVSGFPRPEIKWFLNNLPVSLDDHVHFTHDEEGNIKLEISNVKPQDKGVYTVKVINEHGEAKCFAQLIVKCSKVPETIKYEEVKFAPVFTEIFKDKTAFENTPTKFECILSGKPKPKVKWLFRGEPITENNHLLVSTLGDRQILSIPNTSKDTEGSFTCVAENEVGVASCSATLTVVSLTAITLPDHTEMNTSVDSSFSMRREIHTESSTVMSSKVTSSTTDESEPQTKVHSFSSHDERTFKQVNQDTPEISESHNVEEYLQLGNKQPIIHEKSSSTFSTEKSQTLIPVVHSGFQKPIIKMRAPKFVTPVVGKIIDQNTNVNLEGIIDSHPSPTVTWTKNGKEITSSDRVIIKWEFNKASLEIKDTSTSDGGRYTCTAVNEAGSAISTADIVVRKTIFPPVFGRRLQAQVIKKDDRIIMEVEVTGTPEPSVTWFKDNIPIDKALSDSYKVKTFGNSHSLILEKADLKHTGRYMVRAVNSGGEAQSIADIAVFEPTPDTMVEVVKTVVFEDVRKHETLTTAADKISSNVVSMPALVSSAETAKPPPSQPISITFEPKTFENSSSSSSKSEFSTFTEERVSQRVSTARLEYTAPEIPQPKPHKFEPLEKHMDFQVVDASPQPDLIDKNREENEEGIQTSSISKESSLQYFVKKIEESKESEKEISPSKKVENYKNIEPKRINLEHEKISEQKQIIRPPLQTAKIESHIKEFQSGISSHKQFQQFNLKPEPPAEICYSEPITENIENRVEQNKSNSFQTEINENIISTVGTQQLLSELSTPAVAYIPFSSDVDRSSEPSKLCSMQLSTPSMQQQNIFEKKQFYQAESFSAHHQETTEISGPKPHHKNIIRAKSPRPEALEMEKMWVPAREKERPVSAIVKQLTYEPLPVRSRRSMTENEIVTETPRIHYIANVSHCIQPQEKNIENLFTNYEYSQPLGMKKEYTIKEQTISSSKILEAMPPILKKESVSAPPPKPYPSMDSLVIRPVSVQDITDEVILEPGSPPIIDFAQPPTVRRQSYVETVEHELETKLESIPMKVPPGGIRLIPPPPPPKIAPPPLPPKKEQPTAPPIPAKPSKNEITQKNIVTKRSTFEKFSDLEPFPFQPDPEKPKLSRVGPPPTPSKFIKGKFTDSDYESDFESVKIPPKWKPCSSDNEEPSYRKVKAPRVEEIKRSRSTEPGPLPPSKFDHPPHFQGPPRPIVKFEQQKRITQSMKKQTLFTKQHQEPKRVSPPPVKPGSPPLYVENTPKKIDSPKTKRKIVIDGYMADTDEPFFQQKSSKSETHEIGTDFSQHEYKSESFIESSQKFISNDSTVHKNSHTKKYTPSTASAKKELTATPIITSVSAEKHHDTYERKIKLDQHSYTQQQGQLKTVKYPPLPSPSKFVKSEFRESDYESDYDKPIPKIWKPCGQDDVPHYRPIRPLLTPTGRHAQTGRTPTPPTEFEDPPKTGGPLRPKFEPIDKPKMTSSIGEISKPEMKTVVFKPRAISANQAADISRYIPLRPGTPPELAYAAGPQTTQIYRSTTSMPYHNAIQTETSNIVRFKESNEKCHRTVSVEQSTKVIKFGEKQSNVIIQQKNADTIPSKIKIPPPSSPKKFIPGESRESDYESDMENVRIKPKWAPSGSDTEDLHYRSVRPPSSTSRSSSVPPNKEYIISPMDCDKYSSVISGDTTNLRKCEDNSYSKLVSKKDFTSRSRSYEPPTKRVEFQPGSPPEYGYVSTPKFKSKATNIASHHMDNMTQAFKSKTQKFVRDIMNDVEQQSVPRKSILKNSDENDAQVYREETRAAQYGTKHIDPDTGLIYFKYDFGYEFGIVLPGESKNGGIPVPPKTILQPPKRTVDIEMPVYHEKTGEHQKTNIQRAANKNIKWDRTSESELSEYEANGKHNIQGSDKRRVQDTPPSCPTTPVNSQKGYSGQIRAPMFITPLRNIAVVSGQNAKFECIVQSETCPSVLWSKNGRIIEDSNDYQLHYRNGVCRLTISRSFPEDAGTYTCTATNPAGTASSTATLDVPGEIKAAYIK